MNRILQVFCILFSALILSLGLPNELYTFGSPVYGLISLIPFYLACRNLKGYGEGALLFGLHAVTVHLISSYWLSFFKDFAVVTLGASALYTAVIAFCAGLLFYLPFSRKTKAFNLEQFSTQKESFSICGKVLWFATVYIIYEWLKSCGFVGYPWGTLSGTMFRWKIISQIADITGTYGISFLSAVFAAFVAEGIYLFYTLPHRENSNTAASQYARLSLTVFSLFALTFVYGTFRLLEPAKPEKYINAIIVQQNADPWKQDTDNNTILTSQRLTTKKLAEAKEKGQKIDLVIWSEGCLKYSYPIAENHYKNYPLEKSLANFIKECKIPFILGGTYIRGNLGPGRKLFNAAFLFDKNGEFRGFYGKNHLVPMAESIPFSEYPPVANFLKKVIHISAGFTPGDQYTFFEIPASSSESALLPITETISLKESLSAQKRKKDEPPYVKISTPICFDDSFPDICGPLRKYGSETFINITDDSWSKTKASEMQHFVNSSFRTIEYRISMARSCNSGYSVVLDSKGNIISDLPLFEEAAAIVKIPVYKWKSTVYLRIGNWLPHTAALFALFLIIYTYLVKDRNVLVFSERKKLRKISRKYIKKRGGL